MYIKKPLNIFPDLLIILNDFQRNDCEHPFNPKHSHIQLSHDRQPKPQIHQNQQNNKANIKRQSIIHSARIAIFNAIKLALHKMSQRVFQIKLLHFIVFPLID